MKHSDLFFNLFLILFPFWEKVFFFTQFSLVFT